MESRFHGVPPSAAQMAPKAAPPYKGIRAPLTVDESDLEYSVSKSPRNSSTSSYYSGSEVESEGFESGEDELETVSERPHLVEKDEKILEETHFVKEFMLSETSVKSLDENYGQEGGNVSGNAVLRPFIRIPDGRINMGSSNVDDSRPLVAVKDEEVSENGLSPLVDSRISPVRKLHIPIAQISADSDEDSQGSGVSDGEGFSGIVRIPSIEVLRRINSAPKVRISLSDEGEDDESQGELVEDLVTSNVILGPSDEKEHFDVENSIQRGVLTDVVQEEGLHIDEEVIYNSLVVNEELDSSLELGLNGDSMHIDEEIQEIDVINEQKKCVELVDNEELDSTPESGQNGDAMHFGEEIQEIDVIDEQKKCVELADNEELNFTSESGQNGDPMHLDKEIQEIVIDEQKKFVELVDHTEPTNFSEDVIFPENLSDHIDRKEIVETDCEHEIRSIRQYVDIKEVPAEGCGEFPELSVSTTESMHVYMSDSLFEDAILSVIDAGESVLEGSVLDHESRKEDENRDQLSSEVEESTFYSETKAVIAENIFPDSTSLAHGEISLDHSQEIDGQIVTNFHEEVDADGGISDRAETIADNFVSSSTNIGELEEALSERDQKKIEEIQQIRVKYLRLLQRLGRSPEDFVASKVFYQLALAEKSSSTRAVHLDSTKEAAKEFEAQKEDDFDFSLSILVLGKTGVGKSATINSIFRENKTVIDAFEPSTTHTKEIIGTIDGIKLRIFDTPGLRTSFLDQSINRKILSSIKKLMQKSPPDIILYVDRLDTQTSLNDVPLLKSLTSYLGSSIWTKSIIAFTHGSLTLDLPDGPNGYPSTYEAFVSQKSWIIQQLVGPSTIPVCVVENHLCAEKNEIGETVMPNGESWRSRLLLLCCSMKILSELSSTVMIHNSSNHRKSPLSSLLVCPELSNDQRDVERCYSSDSDKEIVAVCLADMALPPSFDGNGPFGFCFVEPFSRLLTSPVFDSPWDHDDSIETSAGLSITSVGGLKVKYCLAVGKETILVGNTTFRQFSVGRNYKLNVSVALDRNSSGQISVTSRGLDQLQIAALAFVPIARAVFKKIFGQSTEN